MREYHLENGKILGIGVLPQRKRMSLYIQIGSCTHICATFRDTLSAADAVAMIDAILAGRQKFE